jgi:hypothetical protein
MVVHVDEAGRDDETARIDYARALGEGDALTRACRPDTVACDDDNRISYGSAPGTVDQRSPGDCENLIFNSLRGVRCLRSLPDRTRDKQAKT